MIIIMIIIIINKDFIEKIIFHSLIVIFIHIKFKENTYEHF
jgi:hypothetical protein